MLITADIFNDKVSVSGRFILTGAGIGLKYNDGPSFIGRSSAQHNVLAEGNNKMKTGWGNKRDDDAQKIP